MNQHTAYSFTQLDSKIYELKINIFQIVFCIIKRYRNLKGAKDGVIPIAVLKEESNIEIIVSCI